MVKIACFTNLDEYKKERWPKQLSAKPGIGERVTSERGRELKVCSLRWGFDGTLMVELGRWT